MRFVRLDKNERTTAFQKDFLERVWKRMAPDFFTAYPETEKLKKKLATWLSLAPEQIALFAGSDPAIKAGFETFVSPGDEVVFTAPTFAMVGVYGKLFQAKMKPVMMESDLSMNASKIADAISEKTALVYIANPNSPSGTEMSVAELRTIVQAAARSDCPVLVDEAYFHFTKTTAATLVSEFGNLLVSRTFSKACGLAGLRVGYTIGQQEGIELLSKWRPMYEINSFAEEVALELLETPQVIDAYVGEVLQARGAVQAWGKKHDILVYPSATNFVNVKIGKTHIAGVIKSSEAKGILVRESGSDTPLDQCLRISLGVRSQVEPVLEVLERELKL